MKTSALRACALLAISLPVFAQDAEPPPAPEPKPEGVAKLLQLDPGQEFAYHIREHLGHRNDEGKIETFTATDWRLAFRVKEVTKSGKVHMDVKALSFKTLLGAKGVDVSGTRTITVGLDGSPKQVGIQAWMGGTTKQIRVRQAKALLRVVFPPRPPKDTGAGGRWKATREMRTQVVANISTISVIAESYSMREIGGGSAAVFVYGTVKKEISPDRSAKKGKRGKPNGKGKLVLDTKTGLVKTWEYTVQEPRGFSVATTTVQSIPVRLGTFDK